MNFERNPGEYLVQGEIYCFRTEANLRSQNLLILIIFENLLHLLVGVLQQKSTMSCLFPVYDDLGKTTKEFFTKGYYLDIFKLVAEKKRAIFDVDTRISCTHNFPDSTAGMVIEVKMDVIFWELILNLDNSM